MRHRYRLPLLALVGLAVACGASCLPRNLTTTVPPAPAAFYGVPAREDVIRVVNANTQRVQRLQTSGATLESDHYPDLRADLALQPPRRLRLQAGTPLTGPELDLGSNDERFWIWVKRQRPPAVYWARHQQAESGALRAVLPVPPRWLMEAIGLVYLDPQAHHEGPYPRGPGRLEIRSHGAARGGESMRVTVVDSVYGWVLEQYLIDSQGQLLAKSIMSQHQYDPVHSVSLPRRVDITIRPAELAFTLQINHVVLNQASTGGDPDPLWAMPHLPNVDHVDLGDPRFFSARRTGLISPPIDAPWQHSRHALRPWMQRYQGFSGVR